ncbi:unnamed protein product, partial [marine sediment metagenome]
SGYQGGGGNQLTVATTCLRTIQSTETSGSVTAGYVLVDTITDDATILSQYLNGESLRFLSSSNFDNTSLSPNYDSSVSLLTNAELQVYNSRLAYPTYDFSSISDGPTNPNYTTCSGTRYFYGYFEDPSASSNFRLTMSGSSTLVAVADFNPSSDHMTIEIRLPGVTGWLDCMKPFETNEWDEGDGCYSASHGDDITIPTTNLGLTIGSESSANSGDRLYFRIVAGAGWTGYLGEISIIWNAM